MDCKMGSHSIRVKGVGVLHTDMGIQATFYRQCVKCWKKFGEKVMAVDDEQPPSKREELPVCSMCRAALHKLCERTPDLKVTCFCICERGY